MHGNVQAGRAEARQAWSSMEVIKIRATPRD
jgi:hypothetical protein